MLRAERLSLAYPGRTLLEGLTLEFRPGQVWAVLGRNGSGKSTLLHVLAALRRPQAGAALLDGAPLDFDAARRLASPHRCTSAGRDARILGSVRDLCCSAAIRMRSALRLRHMDDEAVARARSSPCIWPDWPTGHSQRFPAASAMRARAAALFAQRPLVYLLDEPLQHLDLS